MYMKPATILFLFTLKHCIEHVSGYVRVHAWSAKNLTFCDIFTPKLYHQ